MTSKLKVKQSQTQSRKKQIGKILRDKLIENKLCNHFYIDLETKIKANDNSVRDIIKSYKLHEDIKNDIKDSTQSLDKNIINKILLRFFDQNAFAIGYNKLARIHTFTDDEISAMNPKQFAEHDSFIVMGCDESTDIDVVCFIGSDQKDNIKDGKTKELSKKSLDRLKLDLKNCGYDIENRKLDVTTAYVDPDTQMIIASSKGGAETQNIILETWTYHKQVMYPQEVIPMALHLHPMIKIEFTQKEIFDKLRSFAKYVLDHCEVISVKNDYRKFRPIKAELYVKGGDQMMKYMRNILDHIIHDPVVASEKKISMIEWHDKFKAIVMKLLQIICLYNCGKTAYRKKDIAKLVREIFTNEDNVTVDKYESFATWYLFRGRIGEYDRILGPKFFELLITCYCDIVDDFLQRVNVKPIMFDLEQILKIKTKNKIMNSIDEELLLMFLKSPNKSTDEFEKEWRSEFKNSQLNSLFLLKSSDSEEFYDRYEKQSLIDEKIISVFKKCFIFEDQRSEVWLDMLENKFVCGKNSGTLDDSFQGLYNLIRGSIIEQLAIHLFDPNNSDIKLQSKLSDHYKWQLGFIVESNTTGSKGFAPDMILIGTDPETKVLELIIVEIKGLKTHIRNADYYRGLNLATKQVGSGKKILSQYLSSDKLIMRRGLILLCYVDNMNLMMEIHQVNI